MTTTTQDAQDDAQGDDASTPTGQHHQDDAPTAQDGAHELEELRSARREAAKHRRALRDAEAELASRTMLLDAARRALLHQHVASLELGTGELLRPDEIEAAFPTASDYFDGAGQLDIDAIAARLEGLHDERPHYFQPKAPRRPRPNLAQHGDYRGPIRQGASWANALDPNR